jgi:hypothetical protein
MNAAAQHRKTVVSLHRSYEDGFADHVDRLPVVAMTGTEPIPVPLGILPASLQDRGPSRAAR